MKKLISRILIVCCIFACLLGCLWTISGREMFYRYSFSRKICENLMQTEGLPNASCFISQKVPDVMEKMFPIGIDQEYVENGMKGFKLVSTAHGMSSECRSWTHFNYLIVPKWALMWDESYIFTFCDGKLINRLWQD